MSSKVRATLQDGCARFRGLFSGPDSSAHLRAFQRALDGTIYNQQKGGRFATIDKVPAIQKRLRDAGFDVEVQPDLEKLIERTRIQAWNDKMALRDRIAAIDAEIFAVTGEKLFPYQKTGAEWLSERIGALLADDMGVGKAIAIDELVLTSEGWRRIGEAKAGDSIIGSDGKPTKVLGVYPQGRTKLYRVTMTDGASVRCTSDHLWYVESANTRKRKTKGFVMTTKEIIDAGIRYAPAKGRERGNSKWFVPMVKPVEFSEKHFELEPYFVGAMIANGSLTSTSITHWGLEDQRLELDKAVPSNYEVRRRTKKQHYSIISAKPRGETRRAFGRLDLLEYCYKKRIPPQYLLGSVSQRLALLQGLMDNDGTVRKTDGIVAEYNTTSPGLCKDVIELVRSLGGSAWFSTRIPTYVYKGKKLKGRRDHRIRMSLPDAFNPFRLPRKHALFKSRTKYPPIHAIESIKPCGKGKAVCIKVEAEDSLYVTSDFILTHNTRTAIVSVPKNAPVLVICNSAAKAVWAGEMARCRPNMKVRVLQGRESFRWPREGEMVVLNYDILPNIHGKRGRFKCSGFLDHESERVRCPGCMEQLEVGRPPIRGGEGRPAMSVKTVLGHKPSCDGYLEPEPCLGCHELLEACLPGTVVIGDEAHYIKNGASNRSKRFRAIARSARERGGRTWLLTGTPVENEAKEMWSVFDAAGIAEEAFGDFATFARLFKGKASLWGFTWGLPGDEDVPEIVERARRVMLRRMKKDVQPDLPTKMHQALPVSVDRSALSECEAYLKRYGGIDRICDMVEKEKIDFKTMASVRAALATAKIPAMLEQIKDHEEQGIPLIVFSCHRAPIDLIRKLPGWMVITGDEDEVKKAKAVEMFQAGKLKGLGLTVRAGGTAITLTYGWRQVWVDRDYNPGKNAQAEDRQVRIGQTKGVCILMIEADHPLERRLNEILLRKQRLIEKSVDAASVKDDASLSKAEREFARDVERVRKETDVRRGPEGKETELFDKLRALVFKSRFYERVALDFAEEADFIGLSSDQWQLLARLADLQTCDSKRASANEA